MVRISLLLSGRVYNNLLKVDQSRLCLSLSSLLYNCKYYHNSSRTFSNYNKKLLANTFLDWSPVRSSIHNESEQKYFDPKLCNRIRNIGLVAHIDAGKTTTTERMLYYSGLTSQMGEVHDGDTVMDYMEQERERGITITMASATINWLAHRINLIDTPGHVDFTFEVERSLSVLDGAVVILDGSAGVQAQTIKVWQQANRYNLPRIIFVNKMDKSNASFERCLRSIEHKLRSIPLKLHLPIYDQTTKTNLNGLIDVVSGACYVWPNDKNLADEGKRYLMQHLLNPDVDSSLESFLDSETQSKYLDQLIAARESLIGQLADLDSEFGELILTTDDFNEISPELLQSVIRKVCLAQQAVPVLCGSSYKKIGVQPLLNSVINYLPSPLENKRAQDIFVAYNNDNQSSTGHELSKSTLCALAFKICFDRRLGALTYLRIYSGTLTAGQQLYNLNRQFSEKIGRIYRPFADHFADISVNSGIAALHGKSPAGHSTVTVGDIVVVSGLSSTITGDTLVWQSSQTASSDQYHNSAEMFNIFAGIEVPDPVFYCSLESPSLSKMKVLETALANIQREDPSFKVVIDRNTNQIVIKGMGELHIDIIKDRIQREYNVDVSSGPLQVSYQESITTSITKTMEMTKTIGGTNNQCKITLEIRPSLAEHFGTLVHNQPEIDEDDDSTHNQHRSSTNRKFRLKDLHIKVVNTKENNLAGQLRPWHLKWIHAGVFRALEYGPLFSFPVVGVDIYLHQFETTSRTTQAFVTNAVSQCMLMALRKASPILLEPIMQLEIRTPEKFIGAIISDLSLRRAEFGSSSGGGGGDGDKQQQDYGESENILIAYVPLSELVNYSTELRTLSSGLASFDMSLHSYSRMDERQSANAIRKISGVDD